MSSMGRYPQNDDASQPIDLHGLNRDAQRPGDQRNAVVLTRLLEHTAELRTATQLLSDRIEQLGRVLASRRPAN